MALNTNLQIQYNFRTIILYYLLPNTRPFFFFSFFPHKEKITKTKNESKTIEEKKAQLLLLV